VDYSGSRLQQPGHGCLYVMRALFRSYGDISRLTLSPTLILMKFLRIFPEICASTSRLPGTATRNIVPGNTWVTVPTSSIGSSFATFTKSSTRSCGIRTSRFPTESTHKMLQLPVIK